MFCKWCKIVPTIRAEQFAITIKIDLNFWKANSIWNFFQCTAVHNNVVACWNAKNRDNFKIFLQSWLLTSMLWRNAATHFFGISFTYRFFVETRVFCDMCIDKIYRVWLDIFTVFVLPFKSKCIRSDVTV